MTEDSTLCNLCPRECGVNREQVQLGFCRMSSEIRVARAALHYWEEPCISGIEGSGAVFFSGCTLRCVFCQNYQIADGSVGKEISTEHLSQIFLNLQKQGANNINLVSAGHFLEKLIPALEMSKQEGLKIPIVYNSSAYEKPESLKKLLNLVDIWLPDFKYWNPILAKKYSHAEDYPKWARLAIQEMVNQAKELCFDKRGILQRGVIVRHLVLPNHIDDSKDILEYLWDTYGNQIYVSIMSQYTPLPHVKQFPELNRKVTEEEYQEVVDYARFLGMQQVYIQEGECAKESFIPLFNYEGI